MRFLIQFKKIKNIRFLLLKGDLLILQIILFGLFFLLIVSILFSQHLFKKIKINYMIINLQFAGFFLILISS